MSTVDFKKLMTGIFFHKKTHLRCLTAILNAMMYVSTPVSKR